MEIPLFQGIFTPYDPPFFGIFWEHNFLLIWGGVVKIIFTTPPSIPEVGLSESGSHQGSIRTAIATCPLSTEPKPEKPRKFHFRTPRVGAHFNGLFGGEIQKGTAGRGRQKKTSRQFTTFCDIFRHFATFYDIFRLFLPLT